VRLASHPRSLFLLPLKVSGVGAFGRATGYGASSAGAGLSAAIVLLLEGNGVSEFSDPRGDCSSGVVGLAVRDSLSACCNASPNRDMLISWSSVLLFARCCLETQPNVTVAYVWGCNR
jgi:hypothetical protein